MTVNPPVGTGACKQKSWDAPRASATAKHLLIKAKDDEDRARLLAASTKESGAWLRALPVSGLGMRLDDASVRIALGLRLGTPICGQHLCQHCGASVDVLGRHALSCKPSGGRHHRHAALNTIISRALTTAGIPSRLEPTGLLRTDGKRPDGMSLAPCMVIREVTRLVCDLLRHLCSISQEPGHTCPRGGSCKSRGEERSQIYQPSSWPSLCSRGSGDYGRHGSANTALFKGAWEESEGPNWGGKVGRLPASKTVSSSSEGECHLHHERSFGGCT